MASRLTRRRSSEVSPACVQRLWLALGRTRVVRSLAILQSGVIIATTASLLAFTAMTWFAALLAGLVLSLAVNLALLRISRAGLETEHRRTRA